MAEFYTKHERYDKAIKLYNSIIETDDTDERAVLGLVQTMLLMGKTRRRLMSSPDSATSAAPRNASI